MVYLIGGLVDNNNYGDYIQAKYWVSLYKLKKIEFKFICNKQIFKKVINTLKLKKEDLVDIDNYVNIFLDKKDILHLYGGGYFNLRFGKRFLEIIKIFTKVSSNVVGTGVQISEMFFENYLSKYKINYLSVRDHISQRLTRNNALIADDSFGYFLMNRKRFDMSYFKNILIKKHSILIQFSLNQYVYEGLNKNNLIKIYKDFILQMSNKFKVILCSSFPKDVTGILENEKLIETLSLDTNLFEYKTTVDLDNNTNCGYKMIIVNSFHTYILALHKFACPVYFLAFSDYYKQKAEALKNYKLLDNKHLITNPTDLYNILNSKVSRKSLSRIKLWKAQNSFLGVIKKVEDILNHN